MAILGTLTIKLGLSLTKAIVKLWLHDSTAPESVGEGLVKTKTKIDS